eukprot:751947-Pelagomonas_calceolata.AAC.2
MGSARVQHQAKRIAQAKLFWGASRATVPSGAHHGLDMGLVLMQSLCCLLIRSIWVLVPTKPPHLCQVTVNNGTVCASLCGALPGMLSYNASSINSSS